MSETPSEIHNRLVMTMVREIVSAGSPTDALVLLESVIVGVILVLAKPGGSGPIHDKVFEGAAARLAAGETNRAQRAVLRASDPAGSA